MAVISRALACLVCLVAATALAYSPRSARLLTEEELPEPSGGGPRPIEVTPPSQPVYGAGEIPPEPEPPKRDVRPQQIVEVSPPVAPAAPRRERTGRLVQGVLASAVVGGLLPAVVTVLNVGSWGAGLAWSVPLSLGIGWLVAPLVTTWAMDGFGVGGRWLVGALLGAAGGVAVAFVAASALGPVGLAVAVLAAYAGPSLGTALAIHTAPDEAFLPREKEEDGRDPFAARPLAFPVAAFTF